MKTISTHLVITGIRSKVDRSLGLTCSTPELSTDERALFMEIQGINLEALFKPTEEKTDLKEVTGEFGEKKPSQRLRAVLFILWKQRGEKEDFEVFYKIQMEKVIDKVNYQASP